MVLGVLRTKPPGTTDGGAKISEILVAAGVPEDAVLNEVRRRILPWYGRLLWKVLPSFVVDPYSNAHLLISDVSYAASTADIDEAFSHYRSFSRKGRRLASRSLGIVPSRVRTLAFFRELQLPARRG